jgi:UDP-N-acetylmuramyl pentapeptide phosphotransferase/UDP-N-acetylglucosamine-1-phosphate transferase
MAAAKLTWVDILRQDVAPVLGAYLAFLAFLVAYRRCRVPRTGGRRADEPQPPPTWRHLVGYLAVTIGGGYVFFLGIVVLFYFVLGNEDAGLITQALGEGSLLLFVLVVPSFLLLSWFDDRRSRRAPWRGR